jgi:spore coat polysaccharide biosynthesis predicted glycosyltransferase SpsG
MRFFFILDCGLKIGAGHVTRNLGIAEELIDRNYEVLFIGNFQNLGWLQKKNKCFWNSMFTFKEFGKLCNIL